MKTEDHETNKKLRKLTQGLFRSDRVSDAVELYWKTHLFDSKVRFDSYLLYMEKDRETQFYFPRRKQLKPLVDALQRLYDRDLNLLAISLPPGVGKTTLALFFVTWLAGKNPEKSILTCSHNKDFLDGAYRECLRMMDPQGEYLWDDVFGRDSLHIIDQNAKVLSIDIGKTKADSKRFQTLEFTSVGAGNAGKVRASNLLYCDDLVKGLEQAMSADQMEKLWAAYTVDLRQRKIGKCVELHIATRWSVNDVIGRLERAYSSDDKSMFIAVPAMNENDESNFDYPIDDGFSTEDYRKQRAIMDEISWKALFMNQPIEREGLLYHTDELRRYFTLPDKEPDSILAVCDTKDTGADFCVMPIALQYGENYYIVDFICDDSNPDIVDERLVEILLKYKVNGARFESNSAGGKTASYVSKRVEEKGGKTNITTKFSTANKETRIILAAKYAKDHFVFRDTSLYETDREYQKAMDFLCSYSMKSKNKHDDVPDAISMLVNYIDSFSMSRVQVFQRPF